MNKLNCVRNEFEFDHFTSSIYWFWEMHWLIDWLIDCLFDSIRFDSIYLVFGFSLLFVIAITVITGIVLRWWTNFLSHSFATAWSRFFLWSFSWCFLDRCSNWHRFLCGGQRWCRITMAIHHILHWNGRIIDFGLRVCVCLYVVWRQREGKREKERDKERNRDIKLRTKEHEYSQKDINRKKMKDLCCFLKRFWHFVVWFFFVCLANCHSFASRVTCIWII